MKKKWLNAAMIVTALALVASGCQKAPADGENPGDVTPPPAEDVYQDYSPNKQPGNGAFDYEGNYSAPELVMDGKGDDPEWQAIESPLATFGNGDSVTVKAYRGKNALFFLFEVKDAVLLTDGNANDDSVTRSDSIEFYIDSLADGGSKPQSDDYQINLGIHGKTRIMQGSGSGWGNWNGLIDYEVFLDGTLNDGTAANDRGYSVEVMIPYVQIGIEKDDMIAVSFGQVDKFGSGSTMETDWKWYGWTYGGKFREPQTIDNYVLLDKDNNLLDRDLQEKPDADMAGYVIDGTTKQAIVGATVTTTIDGKESVQTTDEQGYFVFEKVDPEHTYTVTVSKNGYLGNSVEYTRDQLRAANGGRVLATIEIQDDSNLAKTTVTGTVKNLIDGEVAGATVRVEGTLIEGTTDSDGSFRIEGVPAESDLALVVSKTGYGDSTSKFPLASLTPNGTSELGILNLNQPWGSTDPTNFGLKANTFANSSMKIARTLSGIEMYFTGERMLNGHLEIYLDTNVAGTDRNADNTCWQFQLSGEGTKNVIHYNGAGGNDGALVYELYHNDTDGYNSYFFIPYSYLDIEPLEVFGISLGQWSTSASDWDGWGWNGNNTAPENPQNYIRVNALNQLYKANNNDSRLTLSGNAGQAGVTVKAGAQIATSGANGAWSMTYTHSWANFLDAVTVTYEKQGYVTKTETIPERYLATHPSWTSAGITLDEHTVEIAGKVTDSVSGSGIENVTVTVSDGANLELHATTGAGGTYTISGVTTFNAVTVTFAAAGYAESSETITAANLAQNETYTLNKTLISMSNVQTVTASGKIVDINGNGVASATVAIDGTNVSVTTDANGVFTIPDFEGTDKTLTVSKSGYMNGEIDFKASDLTSGATAYAFADTFLPLDYAEMGGTIANKDETFANFTGYVTRGATGFQFKFTATRAFAGELQLFVDTKTSKSADLRDNTDYRFSLGADGSIEITNYGDGSNTIQPAGMTLSVKNAESAPEILFTLPYTFLGVERDEIIGISLGQENIGWDGWTHTILGANNSDFVKPEMPVDYLRIAKDGTLFENCANYTIDELDLRGYDFHFAQNYDNFHAKVTRDANGVTFDMVAFGDFGTDAGRLEMALIYLDTNATASGGWGNDFVVKIGSDGTVYCKAGAWWLASDGDKVDTVTITRENGVTKFSWTMTYESVAAQMVGISADTVFGVAFREAAHRHPDHEVYGGGNDCDYMGVKIDDTANEATFIRVGADGTLYKAASNA